MELSEVVFAAVNNVACLCSAGNALIMTDILRRAVDGASQTATV